MTGRLEYLPAARAELTDSIIRYTSKAPGLGRRFSDTIKAAEQLVLASPLGHRRVDGGEIRTVVVRHFPFRLMYVVRGDIILVIAVAHTAREPGQFLRRA